MSYTFRPAVRENVTLLIGLAGGTGSGKTWTAMTLAQGIAGERRFAVVDSESRRALHYADSFRFDHTELNPPFRPEAYADAITAADDAGYPVIVVDQMSFEHSGDGGLLDWQEEELTRMAGDDWKKREACKMSSWIRPKAAHRHMMQKLLQVKAHLILCFRAEQKIEMVKGSDGKWIVQPKTSLVGLSGWIPIAEKNLPYELTASFLLTADSPGVPKPIKVQTQHRALFPLDKPITQDSGKRIAEWATGTSNASAPPSIPSASPTLPGVDAGSAGADLFISADQVIELGDMCKDNGIKVESLIKRQEVPSLARMPVAKYAAAKEWLTAAIEYKQKGAT